jgi:hypothetical protein
MSRTISMPGSRSTQTFSSSVPSVSSSSSSAPSVTGTYVYDSSYPHQGVNGQYRYVFKAAQPGDSTTLIPSSSSSLTIPLSSLPNSSPPYPLPKVPSLAASQALYASSVPYQFDREPAAPEGTEERLKQKQRVNPLLNPKFQTNNDAAGLGYGPLHNSHFLYKSHWSTPAHWDLTASHQAESSSQPDAFKHKPGSSSSAARKYHPTGEKREFPLSAAGMGFGHPHRLHRRYLAVKPTEQIMKLYSSQEKLDKFYRQHA